MSALSSSRAVLGDAFGRPVSLPQVLRSEWIKLWSLRSTRWALGLGVLGLVLGVAVSAFDMGHWGSYTASQKADFSPIDTALVGWHLSELAIGVLGILVIAGEYQTGMIRSTFMAVPRRLPVLWAKLGVFSVVTFVLSLPMTFIGFFAASAVLSEHGVNPSLSTPGALRCVLAIPIFLAVLALFTVALGALIRNTAGAIAAFAAVIFVIPGIIGVLSASLQKAINPYLPSNAASAFFTAKPDPHDHLLAPWAGFGVFCAYTAVLIVGAAVLLVRRDV